MILNIYSTVFFFLLNGMVYTMYKVDHIEPSTLFKGV